MKAEKSLVRRRWLSAGAVLTILLLFVSSLAVPVYASQEVSSGVKVSRVSDNVYAVVLPGGKMLIETVSQTFTRITFVPQTGNKTVFEIDSSGSEVVMKVNGKEAYRLPKEKIKPVTFTVKPIQTRNLSPQAQVQALSYAYNYWWDGVYFKKDPLGNNPPYPHPDYDFYAIQKASSWYIFGYKLLHYKLSQQDSNMIGGSLNLLAPFISWALVYKILPLFITFPQSYAGLAVALITTFLASVIGSYIAGPMKDEYGCIWFWVSKSFLIWLAQHLATIISLYLVNPSVGLAYMLSGFLSVGYLRIGPTTYYDAIGAGNP